MFNLLTYHASPKELSAIPELFYGTVYTDINTLPKDVVIHYFCGDSIKFYNDYPEYRQQSVTCVVLDTMHLLPRKITATSPGFYFPKLFQDGDLIFDQVSKEHTMYSLTESDKGGKSFRTGVYLSPVETCPSGKLFQMMRCSTNFQGPTEAFEAIDQAIVRKVDNVVKQAWPNTAPLNHVLCQVYSASGTGKKARISRHSDKTKDMAKNGVIVFCTFYDSVCSNNNQLSVLRFKNKFEQELFDVRLEPGSVFVIDLYTNRQWTHEILPSPIDADHCPVRMGYVVRCSNVKAFYEYKSGQTFILEPLEAPEPGSKETSVIKDLYLRENKTGCKIVYPKSVNCLTLNNGDLQEPLSSKHEEPQV